MQHVFVPKTIGVEGRLCKDNLQKWCSTFEAMKISRLHFGSQCTSSRRAFPWRQPCRSSACSAPWCYCFILYLFRFWHTFPSCWQPWRSNRRKSYIIVTKLVLKNLVT